MGYSDELDKILKKQLDVLIDLAVKREDHLIRILLRNGIVFIKI